MFSQKCTSKVNTMCRRVLQKIDIFKERKKRRFYLDCKTKKSPKDDVIVVDRKLFKIWINFFGFSLKSNSVFVSLERT